MESVLRFGDVEVDLVRLRVLRAEQEVHVQPQVFDVLRYLIEHRPRVIPKEELLDEVWGSRFVTESALSSRIKSARQAIGDDGKRQDYIATVHGRGYRFVAEVESLAVAEPEPETLTGQPGERVLPSLTVAPAVLTGRDQALGRIREAHRSIGRERAGGGILVLRGEAGIGKTALLQTFFDELSGTEANLGLTACIPLRTPTALTPVFDLLEQLGHGPDGLAEIGTPAEAAAAVLAGTRGGTRTLVLGIDDTQWADDATLDVVSILGRRVHQVPVLLVLTARDSEVVNGHPLLGILADLRAQQAQFLDLEPLTEAAVAELGDGAAQNVPDLYARTGGNPLLVSQVLASPAESVPGGIQDIVLARLSQMSPTGRQATEALAMSPYPLDLAQAVAYLGEAIEGLAEAEQRDLITTADNRIAFRHEVVRNAVHDSVQVFQRLPLHRELLQVLPATTPIARRLHHAVEGIVVDTVVGLGPDAAREAARIGSTREAVDLYEKILRHRSEFEPQTEAELTAEYAYQLYLVWDLGEAAKMADRAAELWEEQDRPELQGAALTTLARIQVWTKRAAAKETAASAIELLSPGGPSIELTRAYCELAGLHVVDEDYETGLEVAQIGMEMAEQLSDRGLQALALNYIGCANHDLDLEWERSLRRSIDLAVGADQIEYAARAYANLAVGLWDRDRWLESAAVLDEAEPLVSGVEYHGSVITMKLQLAHVTSTLGDADHALANLAWIRATDRVGAFEFECLVLEYRILMRQGDPAGATGLRQLWASADLPAWSRRPATVAGHEIRSSYATILFVAALAELAWREGDEELARKIATVDIEQLLDTSWRTELGELNLYLSLAGVERSPDQEMPEPFVVAVMGDLEAAAESFERHGRRFDADACRTALAQVRSGR